MGDAGLLGREFQPSFAKELRDQRFDFILQHLFRASGDDEVVRVSNQIDHVGKLELNRLFESLAQLGLQPVQRRVGQHWRGYSPYTNANFHFERVITTSLNTPILNL